MCYILQPDWSMLLLVNTQDYTVNKVAYSKHHFTTSYGITESTTSCQYMENNTHRLL